RIHGYTAEQIVGRHFSAFYPQESNDAGWPMHELEVASRVGRFEDEGWRIRKDGSRYLANVVITALYDDEGSVAGFSKVSRDLTEQRRQEQLLRESEERFRMLVENVKDYALFMLTPEGNVASWNAGAEAIKGYRADEIIGRHFSTFYPPDAIARHWPEHELRMARTTGRFEDEGYRIRKDGSRFWANVVITALFDDKGRLRGFSKLTRDLTMRKQVEELQRTERRMNEFLAMLAHELRNPLAPIQSALDVVERKPDDKATAAWARAIIQRQADQLSRLVDDLLDVSRITRGKITLRREPVDVKATITQVVESMRPTIEERRHTVLIQAPDSPIVIEADPARVSQVLSNIFNNAIKYTSDGGRITVTASISDNFATIAIIDSGIGMSPDLVPRVFDLFVQGERGLDRREGGLGVGLTIAKRLTELQGGAMSAASPGPGLGSRFTIDLPLMRVETATVAEHSDGAGRVVADAKRVLVVDDNRDAADSLAALIDVLGHEATVFNDGRDALAAAAARLPDVVLLDIGLPGMDGFEVARRIRSSPATQGVRLIACTGYGREDDVRRIEEAGFDGYLIKPVSAAQLEKLLAD
ncbi:MAG TPA: PAS domain S-box protein, partial [Gemmatimonadaceae bacterium]